jgi:hypothetical protein
MVLYNVTVKVDCDIADEWVNWMKSKHIPDVMETGVFVDSKLLKLVGMNEADGVTYAVQYFCDSFEDLEKYKMQYAPALQQEHADRYKDKFVAFRTVMETV